MGWKNEGCWLLVFFAFPMLWEMAFAATACKLVYARRWVCIYSWCRPQRHRKTETDHITKLELPIVTGSLLSSQLLHYKLVASFLICKSISKSSLALVSDIHHYWQPTTITETRKLHLDLRRKQLEGMGDFSIARTPLQPSHMLYIFFSSRTVEPLFSLIWAIQMPGFLLLDNIQTIEWFGCCIQSL